MSNADITVKDIGDGLKAYTLASAPGCEVRIGTKTGSWSGAQEFSGTATCGGAPAYGFKAGPWKREANALKAAETWLRQRAQRHAEGEAQYAKEQTKLAAAPKEPVPAWVQAVLDADEGDTIVVKATW